MKAINRIVADEGTFMPGDVFSISNKEAERLIRLKAAAPAKKVVTLEAPLNEKEIEK